MSIARIELISVLIICVVELTTVHSFEEEERRTIEGGHLELLDVVP